MCRAFWSFVLRPHPIFAMAAPCDALFAQDTPPYPRNDQLYYAQFYRGFLLPYSLACVVARCLRTRTYPRGEKAATNSTRVQQAKAEENYCGCVHDNWQEGNKRKAPFAGLLCFPIVWLLSKISQSQKSYQCTDDGC
ncbi:hypothetical protein BX661DRAFT_184968 [Kickxella alabastrina]|uniref:uncharacterized protein n=1 Tax=Kickxella alabastrina TaxID=61397 RepID=UPI00222110E2|nr:uncharacterized protein BX661DRAFT_184968 [Kickxella alabastrina]KAI7824927.1 hypothetical protein BX661DRAFT_184968 [Kickxella alabastrina]